MHISNFFSFIFVLLGVFGCNTYQLPIHSETTNLRIDRSSAPVESNAIQDLITPYKSSLDAQMNEVIGYANISLEKAQPECRLGNWIADVLFLKASQITEVAIDASIQNYGGIRIPELSKGDITLSKIYEIMPFDNVLVIVEMNGDILQLFFDQMALDGGWPVSESVQYIISEGKATQLRVHGQRVEDERTYYIAMPNYIANGNGGCDFLIVLKRIDTRLLLRDILINEVREQKAKGKSIQSKITVRIKH